MLRRNCSTVKNILYVCQFLGNAIQSNRIDIMYKTFYPECYENRNRQTDAKNRQDHD
jgi:hypothetical protein